MVMEVLQEDMGDGSMQCNDHPYKNSTPGGICAFCLQEKLGKLVSSSFPVAIFPSSSSSSSPSFRSEFGGVMINSSSNLAVRPHHNIASSSSRNHNIVNFSHGTANRINDCEYGNQYYSRRSKMPFLLSQRRKKKKDHVMAGSDANSIVFKRSKSTTTPRRGIHFLDADDVDDYSPHKKGFWSFLYLSSKHSASKKGGSSQRDFSYPSSVSSASGVGNGTSISSTNGGNSLRSRDKKKEELVVVDENESPDQAELDRKVSRSRSVGCGSRSFSGDFFERISTGFGDCTLRRVESQREGKPKVASMHRNSGAGGQDCIKERVKCGGIFSGFMITSSSSSSSSSSYWVSSSAEENVNNGKSASTPGSSVRHLAHGRSKSWGWALASPMRAFSNKPSNGKREASNKNATPNLSAIPSLLTVGGG